MGMFTSIYDGDQEYQIKCGHDICEEYTVGDTVNQYIIPDYPGEGYLLDGIYSSFIYPEDECLYYVVIKDKKIEPIQKFAFDKSKDDYWDEYWEAHDVWYNQLIERFPIKPLDKTLWDQEAWDRKAQIEQEIALECEERNKRIKQLKQDYFNSPEDLYSAMLAEIISNPLKRRINYQSIADEIFKVEPLPDGAIPAYLDACNQVFDSKVEKNDSDFSKVSDIFKLPEKAK
jgi:hypothetical protein